MKEAASFRHWLLLGVCVAICAPAPILRLLLVTGAIVELPSVPSVLIFGGAIVAAAFLITWAAETAEKDISQGLALAAIALIAVLPPSHNRFPVAFGRCDPHPPGRQLPACYCAAGSLARSAARGGCSVMNPNLTVGAAT